MSSTSQLYFTLFACLALTITLQPVSAHTYFDSLWQGSTHYPEYEYLRKAYLYDPKENPLPGVTAPDMKCGWEPYAEQTPSSNLQVAAGTTLQAQWWHTEPNDDIIATSHMGPCMVYMAKLDTNGEGSAWFKIWEYGLEETNQTWCTMFMLYHDGRFPFTIPQSLQPGDYLVRVEVIALHNGAAINGAQYYVGCAQLSVTGSGTAFPTSDYLVAFPGAYTATDPGVLVDLYNGPVTGYKVPGPPVWPSSDDLVSFASQPVGSFPEGQVTPSDSSSSPASGGGGSSTPTPSSGSSSSTQPSSTDSSSSTQPSNGLLPTTVSTCGSISVSKAQRVADEPVGHNLFDLTVTNTGAALAPGSLTITIIPSSNTVIQQSWNLVRSGTSNTYSFQYTINAASTYTGAGFVAQGSDATANGDVQIVCATTGSSSTVTPPASSSSSGSASQPASSGSSSQPASSGSSSQPASSGSSAPSTSASTTPSSSGTSSPTSCGSVVVTQTARPPNGGTGQVIYDITLNNQGAAIPANSLFITITPSGTNAVVQQVWNLLQSGSSNQYAFQWAVNAGGSYTGAGYIVQGSDSSASASIQVVCSTSGSSSGTVTPPPPPPPPPSASTTGAPAQTPTTSTVAPPPSGSSSSSGSATGSSGSCNAGISFSLSQSWVGGGMVGVTISNTGATAITSVTVNVPGGVASSAWNLLPTGTADVYTLPSWVFPLAPGSKFTSAGYTFTNSQPASGSVISAAC